MVAVVMLIGAWIAKARFNRPRPTSDVAMIGLYEQQVSATRRPNAALERIATALDKRP